MISFRYFRHLFTQIDDIYFIIFARAFEQQRYASHYRAHLFSLFPNHRFFAFADISRLSSRILPYFIYRPYL